MSDYLYDPALGDFFLPGIDSPDITDDEWDAATAYMEPPEPVRAAIDEAELLTSWWRRWSGGR